jgi:hypothetical protein
MLSPYEDATDAALPSSFRDPSGFVFERERVIYRQVNASYREDFDHLLQSGLYEALQQQSLLIPHEDVTRTEAPRSDSPDTPYRILRPEPLEFVSYPYEWCFSQWKEAALTTLRLQKEALRFGMSLKDANAYNIQFRYGKPLLIDTLSFERYQEGEPWVAYRQFCQHFLAPLALMSHTDIRLGMYLRIHLDGIPLDLASHLLPWKTRFSPGLFAHIHLHAATQKRYADRPVKEVSPAQAGKGGVSKNALLGLVDSLESAVRSLDWTPKGTVWANYYNETNYTDAGMEAKHRLVTSFLDTLQERSGKPPRSVWDLGANTGRFSRIASERGISTIAWDSDPAAVEQGYRDVQQRNDRHLLPLLQDLTNPSPELGWAQRERLSFLSRGPADVLFALAVVHHLALANNVPLPRIAQFLREAGNALIIEFVPPQDSQAQRLLNGRADRFPHYTQEGFEAAFGLYWETLRAEPVEHGSQRILYLMRPRGSAE